MTEPTLHRSGAMLTLGKDEIFIPMAQ